MIKRKAENNLQLAFNEQWENEFLLIAAPSGKPLCIVCENPFCRTDDMILIDTIQYSVSLK